MSKLLLHLSLLILLLFSQSCRRKDDRNQLTIIPETETGAAINLQLNDTFTVKGDAVVFYKPTYEEAVLIMRSAKQPGFDSEISDLEINYNRVMNLLKNSNVISFMTTARFISVESNEGLVVHDRLTDSSVAGVIFSSPNKHAKVFTSIHTQAEYNREIKEYFF